METKSLTWWLDVILRKEMDVKDGTGYDLIINEVIKRLGDHDTLLKDNKELKGRVSDLCSEVRVRPGR